MSLLKSVILLITLAAFASAAVVTLGYTTDGYYSILTLDINGTITNKGTVKKINLGAKNKLKNIIKFY